MDRPPPMRCIYAGSIIMFMLAGGRESKKKRRKEEGGGPLIRSQVGGRENSSRAILFACYIEAARFHLSLSFSFFLVDVARRAEHNLVNPARTLRERFSIPFGCLRELFWESVQRIVKEISAISILFYFYFILERNVCLVSFANFFIIVWTSIILLYFYIGKCKGVARIDWSYSNEVHQHLL